MKKTIVVLALICSLGFIQEEKPQPTINLPISTTEAIQKIIAHSVSILDNGTYRNNYDSVKIAIQELSSIYNYLDQLKKAAQDTTKKK